MSKEDDLKKYEEALEHASIDNLIIERDRMAHHGQHAESAIAHRLLERRVAEGSKPVPTPPPTKAKGNYESREVHFRKMTDCFEEFSVEELTVLLDRFAHHQLKDEQTIAQRVLDRKLAKT